MTKTKWLKLILGCALFGILMGIRPGLGELWLRVVVAVVAGAVLGSTIGWMRASRA